MERRKGPRKKETRKSNTWGRSGGCWFLYGHGLLHAVDQFLGIVTDTLNYVTRGKREKGIREPHQGYQLLQHRRQACLPK